MVGVIWIIRRLDPNMKEGWEVNDVQITLRDEALATTALTD
jgi:hypothetical protein